MAKAKKIKGKGGCICKNPVPKQTNDKYNTVYCEDCFEVISFEAPTKTKERKVKKDDYKPTKEDLDKIEKLEINKVYNCDVFDLIKKLPNEYIDLVVTDPPYGDGTGYGRKNKEIFNNADYKINLDFLDAIYPKMKTNSSIYIFSNHKYYEFIKNHAIEIGLEYKALLILMKNNIGMGNPFRNQYEVCLVFDKGSASYYLKDFSNVVKMKSIKHNNDSHPHIKEEYVIRKIIRHSSKEGDLVFDGFMGSFSTAKCCIKEKRNYIGSELDKKWHKEGIRELKYLKSKKTIEFEDDDKEKQLTLL